MADKMKKRHKWIGIVGLLVIAGILVIHYYTAPREVVPEFVFTYAENQTEDYPTTQAARRFAELVEERTDGRIRIVVHPEGELGTENEVIRQMHYGGIDFARVSLSQLAEYVPELNVLQMPYLYVDSDHMWKILDGEIGDSFLLRVRYNDLVGLSWYDAGTRNFYNSVKPIHTPADMVGMSIRVQESEVMVDMVEALGATALPISYEEVYPYLQKGICDGAENNWPSYEAMRHCNVAPYYTVDEHTRVPEMQICSAHTWEKISTADRAVILECAAESAQYQRQLWTEREELARQAALERGVEEIRLTAGEKKLFQDKMSEIYEKYCSDYMDIIDRIMEEGKK